MTKKLEDKLTERAWEACAECRKFKYNPTTFERMLSEHKGRQAIKRLLAMQKPSDGFTKLWEEKKLHLSVEALILENPEFHELFTEAELQKARKWLKAHEYKLKVKNND